jgi:hypothetical protein
MPLSTRGAHYALGAVRDEDAYGEGLGVGGVGEGSGVGDGRGFVVGDGAGCGVGGGGDCVVLLNTDGRELGDGDDFGFGLGFGLGLGFGDGLDEGEVEGDGGGTVAAICALGSGGRDGVPLGTISSTPIAPTSRTVPAAFNQLRSTPTPAHTRTAPETPRTITPRVRAKRLIV